MLGGFLRDCHHIEAKLLCFGNYNQFALIFFGHMTLQKSKIFRAASRRKWINDVMIFRFEDYLLQIQPESRANTAAIATDVDTDQKDAATDAHVRGVITTVAGRTEPPPARFLPTRK